MEIVDQTATEYKVKYIYDIYQRTATGKNVIVKETVTQWIPIDEDVDPGDFKYSTTLTTSIWGSVNVDVYENHGTGQTMYISPDNGMIYKFISPMFGITMTLDLIKTNMI
jgi:hypothetical protein